jgi:RNA polymerase sigma-70 factor (ECF subfamily)
LADGWAIRAWAPELRGETNWTVRVIAPEDDGPRPAGDSALDTLDDTALIAASVAGRRDAFDAIVERHRRAVYQVCYRFTGNHEDAADLSQEAFVRAWRGLKSFKGDSALSTWLYRITVNVCLNKVSAKQLPVEEIQAEKLVDVFTEDARAALLREERAVAVRRAIAQLPEKQRATLILRTYQELSHQEIADILGNSVGAVKANFFHALGNLKKILRNEP